MISGKINILFTCVGRRVSLVECFKQAAKDLGMDCGTFGTDMDSLSPGLYVCDEHAVSEPIGSGQYIPSLLKLCEDKKIDLLIPTIDTELRLLAQAKGNFESLGTTVLISPVEVIATCQDKRKTFGFLRDNNFGTPETKETSDANVDGMGFPLFLKPWNGSASKSNAVAHDPEEYHFLSRRIPNCIIQEYIDGQEYTCDVYVDFEMNVRVVVPRKRISVRAGEVSKAQTVRNEKLIAECGKLVKSMGAGPGVITIQCFVNGNGETRFIEINPRFGGGIPLSIHAGADFPKWILSELRGENPDISPECWEDGMYMLRYDEAVWCDKDLGEPI